jgi:5-methylcytosine-specific restriction enzyme subunit McrC
VSYLIFLSEQLQQKQLVDIPDLMDLSLPAVQTKSFYYRPDMFCFKMHNHETALSFDTNYFVGADWLIKEKLAVYVEPKLNDVQQVDFLRMLIQSLDTTENLDHLDKLFHIEYDEPWIHIPQQKDLLSPILIVQFLKLVQRIVHKGLKKSYYRVTKNLNGVVKGKILVGPQIRMNILKNKLTSTICNYQEYGTNSYENQFLKLVLKFVSTYLNQKNQFFDPAQQILLKNILDFCNPAFEHVDVLQQKHKTIRATKNTFYTEYEDAMRIGSYILKRFSFNIDKASEIQVSTPPFWIDMSKLFELYVFGKLTQIFTRPGAVTYHDKYLGGKETDILIREKDFECVVDCKYKPQYKDNSPSLEDKRQLAGYTRLQSVYNKLGIATTEVVKGLLIFSHQDYPEEINRKNIFENKIGEYVDFYKAGIKLPELAK